MKVRPGAVLAACCAIALGLVGSGPGPAVGAGAADEEVGRLLAQNARLRHALRAERARSHALISELERQGRAQLERELAWRDLHAQLGRLSEAVDPAAVLAEALDLEVDSERRAREERAIRAREDLEARRARADALRVALNARLRVEGFDGFDLFEAGLLAADRYPEPVLVGGDGVQDGSTDGAADDDSIATTIDAPATDGTATDGTATAATPAEPPRFGTGPVVLRLFDHRGVLAGSLVAEHLHLEASRTGHSVTIVLTDGHSRVDDQRLPFDGGVYRIPLRHVDPVPFLDACAPLFDPQVAERIVDDGRWSRPALLLTANRLLEASDRDRRHRLSWLGGVVDRELRDVELSVHDAEGRETERLIADGLSIELFEDHVRLVLRDGLALAGDGARTPFRNGRRTIVLVDADPAAFAAAHLPLVHRHGPLAAQQEADTESSVDTEPAPDEDRAP